MAEKQECIRLSASQRQECLKYGSINQGVKYVIDKLVTLRKLSLVEIKGKFSVPEWSIIAISLKEVTVEESMRYEPKYLIQEIEDADLKNNFASEYNVSLLQLCKKIAELTAAQLDSVHSRVEAYWGDANRPELEKWARF